MNYNELNSEVMSINKKIVECNRQITQLEEKIQDANGNKTSLENNFRSTLAKEKQKEFDNYVASNMKPLEASLKEAHSNLKSMQDGLASALNFDKGKLRKSIEDDYASVKGISDTVTSYREQIRDMYGEDYLVAVESHTAVRKLDVQQLGGMEGIFKIKKKQKKENPLVQFLNGKEVDSLFDGTMKDKKGTAIACVAGIVAVIAFFRFVAPIYFVGLAIYGGISLWRNYRQYITFVSAYSVQASVDSIQGLIEERFNEEVKKREEDAHKQYDEKIQKEFDNIADLTKRLSSVKAESMTSFNFDSGKLNESFQTALTLNETQLSGFHADLQRLQKEREELYEKLKIAKDKLIEYGGTVMQQYLDFNKVGTDYKTDGVFLVDVDKGKPILFKHNLQTSLFLYDTLEEAQQFIRLMCVQLRMNLAPFSLCISVVDLEYRGVSFLPFQSVPVGSKLQLNQISKLYNIIQTNSEFDDMLSSYYDEIGKRMKNFGTRTLNEYNDYMAGQGSVVETNDFLIIFIDGFRNIKDEFKQLLNLGPRVGVVPNLFADMHQFLSDKANEEIVNRVNRIYYIQNGKIQQRAKDFVLDVLHNL